MNYQDYIALERLKDDLARHGLRLGPPNGHTPPGFWPVYTAEGHFPSWDKKCPICSFETSEEIAAFLTGLSFMKQWDNTLGFTDAKRNAAEDKIRHRQLIDMLKTTVDTDHR